ncbi:MAG: AraC family transcriptional regulator [Polyangiales bacterium]
MVVPEQGILNPRRGEAHFTLSRHAPPADLAGFVERFWIVRWELAAPYEQETLPFPCGNLVIGTHRPGLFGVVSTRFVARLEGRGWVVGAKFRPGGLRAFVRVPMFELTDQSLAIETAFGREGAALDRDLHALDDDDARIARFTEFLRGRAPVLDEEASEASRIVDLVYEGRSIARVSDLAEESSVPVRTLERSFRNYVGVSPKWVIRRARVQDAAARVSEGDAVDWPALAHELGYFDQAHFIRDFKAQVGRTPADYAAWCRSVSP